MTASVHLPYLILWIGFLFHNKPVGHGLELSAEKHLIRKLLSDYEQVTQHGRPVLNISQPVDVRFGLGLIQMELDEREKALSLSLWSKYVWEDHYLQWVPEEYADISSIKLPSKLIWLPDIMLYNTAETEISARDTLATIFYNGTVVWVPHQKLKSSCSIDVTNFPFDHQQCHMWFGSWTYTTRDINLTMAFQAGLDLSTFHADFKDTSQWAITESRAERRVLPSENIDPNFSVLTYTLGLKRNLVFASYILTLPCVFLACLTLVVFWLPPDRPDRTALAMSIFASFLLLLLILVEAAPPTANSVPSLGIYYCFNMVIIMMAVFLSSLVVNVCQVGDTGRPVPRWLRKVTMEGPVRYICMCNGLLPIGAFYREWSRSARTTPPSGPCSNFNPELEDRSYMLTPDHHGESIPLKEAFPHYTSGGGGGGGSQDNDQDGLTIFRDPSFPDDLYHQPQHHQSSQNHQSSGGGAGRAGADISTAQNNNVRSDSRRDPEGAATTRRKANHNSGAAQAQKTASGAAELTLDGSDIGELVTTLRSMHKSVRQLEQYFYTRSREEHAWRWAKKQWKNVAFILDRIFFLLYVCLIILSVAILFPRPD